MAIARTENGSKLLTCQSEENIQALMGVQWYQVPIRMVSSSNFHFRYKKSGYTSAVSVFNSWLKLHAALWSSFSTEKTVSSTPEVERKIANWE